MHFHLNPHTILPILCLIFSLLCGVFVLCQNPQAKLNQTFATICITFLGWFSYYIGFNFDLSEQSLTLWFRIAYCLISFIPIMCFRFVTIYLQTPRNDFWFRFNALIGLIFSILSIATPWIINGVIYYPWHPYPKAGILHPLLVLHCIYLALYSLVLMLKALQAPSLPIKQRNHLKYMFSALACLTCGAIDFIKNYNILLYEFGYIPVTCYLILTTIAIVKHQLMDIQIVIRKSIVYSVLVSFITLIFLILFLITEKISQNFVGYHENILNSFILSVLIAIIFIPLRNKIQESIDKIFFKGTPIQIAEENKLLRQEIIQTERLKTVATLASGMAHEIKNPLTVLKSFSEALPNRLDDKAFLAKFAPMIQSEVDRIDNLVHELLDFARPASPVLKSVNIHNLLNSTLELLSNNYIKHHIKIEKNYRISKDIFLSLDQNQIKQALFFILLNAIDAMRNGGELDVSTSYNEEMNAVRIKIQDTGIGIDTQDLPHIFDPFFSKKDGGTGLGLSITYEIIKLHSGKIFVESSKDKGTAFILEFPLLKEL
jgi:signal transduction histidine kinase